MRAIEEAARIGEDKWTAQHQNNLTNELNNIDKLQLFLDRKDANWLMRCFVESFQTNTSITSLTLYGYGYNLECSAAFAAALAENQTLKQLSFTGLTIGSDDINPLATALQENRHITELTFFEVTISPENLQQIMEALGQNTALKKLKVNATPIMQPTAISDLGLATMLASNKTLTYLSLDSMRIGNQGLYNIASALQQNHSLHRIQLGSSPEFYCTTNVAFHVQNTLAKPLIRLGIFSPQRLNMANGDRTIQSIRESTARNRARLIFMRPALAIADRRNEQSHSPFSSLPIDLITMIFAHVSPKYYTQAHLQQLDASVQKVLQSRQVSSQSGEPAEKHSNITALFKLLGVLSAITTCTTIAASYALTGSTAILAPYALLAAAATLLFLGLVYCTKVQPKPASATLDDTLEASRTGHFHSLAFTG